MHKYSVSFILLFIGWLLFTSTLYPLELAIGLIVSIVIALIAGRFMFFESPWQLFNPKSITILIIYSLVLIKNELTSIPRTSWAILTGNISPAIVKIPTAQKRDFTKTLVANSITLTPGTLTLRISDDDRHFYIHALNYKKNTDISADFERWAKKVAS